jgi:hypothetical protein
MSSLVKIPFHPSKLLYGFQEKLWGAHLQNLQLADVHCIVEKGAF